MVADTLVEDKAPTTYSALLEVTTTLDAAVPVLVMVYVLVTGLALVQTEPKAAVVLAVMASEGVPDEVVVGFCESEFPLANSPTVY